MFAEGRKESAPENAVALGKRGYFVSSSMFRKRLCQPDKRELFYPGEGDRQSARDQSPEQDDGHLIRAQAGCGKVGERRNQNGKDTEQAEYNYRQLNRFRHRSRSCHSFVRRN